MMVNYWTEEDIKFLKDNYSSIGVKECSLRLNRTLSAIMTRAYELGLKAPQGSWTPEEIQYLRDNYYELGPQGCSLKINRTYDTIKRRASLLGLKKSGRAPLSKRYTNEEILFLQDTKQCITCGVVKRLVGGFTRKRNKAGTCWIYRSKCIACYEKTIPGKICVTCGKAEEFIRGGDADCRKCHNDKENIKGSENKLKAIGYLGGVCKDCNKEFPPGVYDLHHRDPLQKESQMARAMRFPSWDKIKKELDKCDLLCANCHRIRHINEKKEI